VYTRKVDYLHKLVYKALYEFCKTHSSSQKDSSRRKINDSDIEEFYDFDPHMEFLLLDDVVPEDHTNQKINLNPYELGEEEGASSNITPTNQSMHSQNNRTRLSLGGLSVTRLERSMTGAFSSSAQQRALLGTINNGRLRLVGGTCDIGDNGVLLMPGSNLLTPSSTEMIMDDASHQPRRSLFGEEGLSEQENIDLAPQGGDDYEVDDDDDGPGFEMNFDDQASEQPSEEVVYALQQQRKQVTFATDKPSKVIKERKDPWALLDPHYDGSKKPKPLKKGRTIRLPEGMEKLPSECVTGARTRQMKERPRQTLPDEDDLTTKYLAADTFQAFLRNQFEPPKIPITGLVFKEFSYIAKKKAKQRAQARRAERKKEMEDQNLNHESQSQQHEDIDDDDDDYGGGFDFGGGDDYDDDDHVNAGDNTGLASLDDVFQNNGAAGDNHGKLQPMFHPGYYCKCLRIPHLLSFNIDDPVGGKTFEELCRAHIQAFARGAEDFAFNTKLSERVDKWQSKLVPILEEEERRSVFDIHMYSQRLIDSAKQGLQRVKRKSDGSIEAVPKSVDFETVTRHCTQSDVCRLFLASLSLANSGNLKIDENLNGFRFDLLSSTVEPPMAMFKASSLVEGR
jgi:condensin-2 complex subunit H2